MPHKKDRMRFRVAVAFLGILVLFSAGCSKESKSEWNYCQDCSAAQWVGNYSGIGDYYNGLTNVQYLDLTTNVVVSAISETGLKIEVDVPDYYQISFTALKNDNAYYINVPGSTKSLAITLALNGSSNRLTGSAKAYHYKADTVIVDHSVGFEVIAERE